MELKLLAAIHISFTRSNLDSDETKSERLCIETGYKKNLTKQFWRIKCQNLPTNQAVFTSHVPNRVMWLFCLFRDLQARYFPQRYFIFIYFNLVFLLLIVFVQRGKFENKIIKALVWGILLTKLLNDGRDRCNV